MSCERANGCKKRAELRWAQLTSVGCIGFNLEVWSEVRLCQIRMLQDHAHAGAKDPEFAVNPQISLSVYIDSFTFYPKPKLLYNLYGEHLDLGRRLVFGGNYTVGSSLQLVST